MKKRLFSALLVFVLLLGICPAAAGYSESEPSDECIEFIKAHESFMSEAYRDGDYWYIGYGTQCEEDEYPDGIDEETADELLREKMTGFTDYINSFLKRYDVEVTQGQFDALASMTYSLGTGWMSTENRLPGYLATGIDNYTDREIMDAFVTWCHIGRTASEGLLRRRITEAKMFLYDDYDTEVSDWKWVIFDLDGGTMLSDVAAFPTGERYSGLPTPEKNGYDFIGWETSGGEVLGEDDRVRENLRVKAVWQREETAEEPDTEPEAPSVPEAPSAGVFSDVSQGQWFESYVTSLASRGVISGYPDGTFRPQSGVTLGEGLKLILLAAGYPEKEPLAGGHWASGYLKFAEDQGFTAKGSITDLDRKMTRFEMASLVARALPLPSAGTQSPFADTTSADAAALYAAGIAEGSLEGGSRLFKGNDGITRAEISAIVYRVLGYVDENIILFSGHRIPVDKSLEQNPYDGGDFRSSGGRVYYDSDEYDVQYGIDVSFYQNDIDWNAVASDGIDFAIIRGGYRGCSEGEMFEDTRFREYIEGAKGAGLDVGLYFFSQAINEEEAREEARFLIALADEYGVDYPLIFDWEPLSYSYSRTNNFDYSRLTKIAVAFCETIEDAGYVPMVYLNPSFAYLRYDLRGLDGIDIWLAHYTETTNYRYDFKMWQYGSSGSVSGIAGRVDMDIAFKNYAK